MELRNASHDTTQGYGPKRATRTEPADGHPSSFDMMCNFFRKLRDLSVGAAGIMYLFGYGVWSWYAYTRNLGTLPILQSQYFLAGLIPSLIALLVVAASIFTKKWHEMIAHLLSSRNLRLAKRARITLIWVTVLLSFVILSALGVNVLIRHLKTQSFYVAFTALAFLLPTIPLWGHSSGHGRKKAQGYTVDEWMVTACVPAILGTAYILAYTNAAFPYWPQELGGALPHVVMLDVSRSDLSSEEQVSLLPASSANSKSAVVRTKKVLVYFRNDQRLLLKDFPNPTSQTYEVSAGSVKATVSIGSKEALSVLLPHP